MKKLVAALSCIVLALCLSYVLRGAQAAEKTTAPASLLSHNVYFSLHDASPEGKQKFIDSCKKHLSKDPGAVFFAVGTLCDEQKGERNDRDFDVVLSVVFTGHDALNTYLKSKHHDEFLAESLSAFKKARVFDADVERLPTAQ